MRLFSAAALSLVAVSCALAQNYIVQTIAGGALPVNIPGTSASLPGLNFIAVDSQGNVFIADPADSVVLRLDAGTGVLTLAAGSGVAGFSGDGGPATSARLSSPNVVALDPAGNLYIFDAGNNRIRKVSNGSIATVAGNGASGYGGDNGPATDARLLTVVGLAADAAGNLYIADSGNFRIREVSNGVIHTVAGTGVEGYNGDNIPATSAELDYPYGVAVDSAGNLYVADQFNNRVRKVSNGVISTVAGGGGVLGDNGPANRAQLIMPLGIALDGAGNLYISDGGDYRIRKVSNGTISTVAGNGWNWFSGDNGPATSASLCGPDGVGVDSAGNLYIADSQSYRVRKVTNGTITTVAGGGTVENIAATSAQLLQPMGVAVAAGGSLYIADTFNNRIRKVSNGVITTVAGNGIAGYSGDGGPAVSAQLCYPWGVAVDAGGNLYIADYANERLRKVSNGVITTIAGTGAPGFSGDNGAATLAQFDELSGVAVDSAGDLYIADEGNQRIRKISHGIITTVAGGGNSLGDNGPATSAHLGDPHAVSLDSAGNLYIADALDARVRKVANGVITTVAGTGTNGSSGDSGPAVNAQLSAPYGVAVDSAGSLYIVDNGAARIRKVSNGVIHTIAGNGVGVVSGDGGLAADAEFLSLAGIAVDPAGRVYFSDSRTNRVRVLAPTATYLLGGGYLYNAYTAPPSPTSAAAIGVAVTGWVPDTCYPTPTGAVSVSGQNVTVKLSSTEATGVACGQVWMPFTAGVSFGPLPAGVYTVTYQMILDGQMVESISEPLDVVLPPTLTSPAVLHPGFVGGSYSETLSATGGAPPYAWALLTGPLPGGLTLSGAGAISGYPTIPGSFSFTVLVTDANGATAVQTFTIAVASLGGPLTRTGVFPQVAAGGGWGSSISLTNASPAPVAVLIALHADAGGALTLPITVTQLGDVQTYTASSVERVLYPDTTLVVASGAMVSTVEGWAEVIASGPVDGSAFFRYAPQGLTPGPGFTTPIESAVALQTQLSANSMILHVDNTGGFSTAVALGSLASSAFVTAVFYGDSGVAVDSPQQIPLPPGGHTAFVTNLAMPFTENQTGIVEFTGTALFGLGLRASPYGTLTSIPAVFQ